ncbi:MAG: hypothetical protein JKY81_06380 [Colwellia sp.]|nr:hypothetical protein [Colwellia sp.]
MTYRLNWLLSILIYLLVNGNLFAVPVHLCQSMAVNYMTTLSALDALKIHDHHSKSHQSINEHLFAEHEQYMEIEMESCACVECDCTIPVVGQITTALITKVDLILYLPSHADIYEKRMVNFISQPQTNPLRPPILT